MKTLWHLLGVLPLFSALSACSESGGSETGNTEGIGDCPPQGDRTEPLEHSIAVTESGEFIPPVTCIAPGDTVVWEFAGSPYLHSIIPVAEPAQDAAPAELCRNYQAWNPDDANEFTGPMPEAVSGIFSRADDEQGLVGPGEVGACERYGPCVPQPGRASCSGAKLGKSEVINAGECYGPGRTCEPPEGKSTCTVPKQEPGNYFYTNHHTTWANPGVTGVLFVFDWRDLEPAKGQYYWEELDRTIQDAVDHGKFYSLVIKADATRTGLPDWLFAAEPEGMGLDPLIFFDQYGNGETCEQARNYKRIQAHILDYRFRERYLGVLAAIADHIKLKNAHYRALAYIKPSGANLQSPENHLPQGCLEEQYGASPEACGCVDDKQATLGLEEAIAQCSELHGDASCCGLCNDEIWATTKYLRGKSDTEGSTYSASDLVDFYTEQTAHLARHYPGKSMAYALIQDGFPKRGIPAGEPGTWITEQILRRGAEEQGLEFVVQHNALNNQTVLDPWVMYRTSLDYPDTYDTQFGITVEEYIEKVRLETPWLPEAAGIAFKQALILRWEEDRAALQGDPEYAPLSTDEYLAMMAAAGVEYRDACLLPGETAPTHPKTMQHYRQFSGGRGACANAQVIASGALGQITGKQNNSGIQYSDQFLSSLDNAEKHTDAIFVEAYEKVIQRAMADGKDLMPYAEPFHERRRADWNSWAADKLWSDRTFAQEAFPTTHRHTFAAETDAGQAPSARTYHFVHGQACLSNSQVGKVVLRGD